MCACSDGACVPKALGPMSCVDAADLKAKARCRRAGEGLWSAWRLVVVVLLLLLLLPLPPLPLLLPPNTR